MQSLVCEKMQAQQGVFRMMKNMVMEEGLFSLWRGAPAMVVGAGPAHVMYFGALELGKNLAQKSKSPVLHDNKFLVDGNYKSDLNNNYKETHTDALLFALSKSKINVCF